MLLEIFPFLQLFQFLIISIINFYIWISRIFNPKTIFYELFSDILFFLIIPIIFLLVQLDYKSIELTNEIKKTFYGPRITLSNFFNNKK